jgi:hypothetical protein
MKDTLPSSGMWRRSVWWIGAKLSETQAAGLVQSGRVSRAEVTGTVLGGGGRMLLFALKGLLCGIRLRRDEMKSESRGCVINGKKVNAVLNKVTFSHQSVQSQFLPAFPYINYQFHSRGIPFYSGEGDRTWMRSVGSKSSETHSFSFSRKCYLISCVM